MSQENKGWLTLAMLLVGYSAFMFLFVAAV